MIDRIHLRPIEPIAGLHLYYKVKAVEDIILDTNFLFLILQLVDSPPGKLQGYFYRDNRHGHE